MRAGRLAWRAGRWGAGSLALWRLAAGASRRPGLRPLRPGLPLEETVSVVIPARDEAGRIAPCLEALRDDPQVFEVIVVDDESSDGTAALARSLGARVITGRTLPSDWVGKPWALQQGLEAATGDWVLTLDADTRPQPGLVAAMVACSRDESWDLLSLGGRFRCDGSLEQALHAAMLATLVYRFGPPGRRRPAPPQRRIANGQCLLARRAALLAVGGFTLAAGALTDDIALVRSLAQRGWRTALLDGSDCLEVRMHSGAAQVWREWGRSLPMVDATSPPWLLADLAVLWLALAFPWLRLLTRRADRMDAALLCARLGLVAAISGSYCPPRRGLWLSPLLDVAAVAQLTAQTLRPARRWRGRDYARRAGSAAR